MIIKLPDEVVRRIAAGEVVDHPASVVKELIENAIDAHASNVKISIESGGKSSIIVDDNGTGMNEDDLRMAVLPHTTSKISNFEDIFNLTTFGFRGEAIASIGAVSKMKIESSDSKDGLGHVIEVIGGIVGEPYPISKSLGTRVSVSDLFFNVPARRKFLSSTSVETRMVTEIVEKFILSSNIEIEFLRDGELVYKTHGMTDEEKIKMIFGNQDLIRVDDQLGGMRIHGYISTPEVGRQNRLNEVIFVNGRYVKSPLLLKAIEAGYAQHLKKGEFPTAIIFIEVPPQVIDVNVHPQKLEVKFSDQSRVFGNIASTIKKALASPDVFKIPVGDKQIQKFEEPFSTYEERSEKSTQKVEQKLESFDFVDKISEKIEERERLSDTQVLGVLKGRYLITYSDRALYIIDIHATHERIIFDRIKVQTFSSQRLVEPIEVELNQAQLSTLEDHKEEIKSFGFEFDGRMLLCVPSIKHIEDWKELFISTIENFRVSFAKDPREEFFADVACKMAVKTGEMVSNSEIRQLLSDMDKLKIWSCPHGRPLVYSIELKRLDRFFGR